MSESVLSELVTIKENAVSGKPNLGLEKEGRSKFPGCYDIIQPAKGRDGRWKTGMDEKARYVLAIRDQEQRLAKQAELQSIRESLEELTGLDLSATSKFWDTFFVEVNVKKPLDMTIPMDRIKYYVLTTGEDVAPSLADTNKADYFNSKYYVSKKHEDVAAKLDKKKKHNDAVAAMLELLKTPDRAILVGKYLNLPINNTTPQDNIYDAYQTKLDDEEKNPFIDKFMRALSLNHEEINVKIIFDDGIKQNVIRLRDGLFQRGNITYGRSIPEAITFLTDIKNRGELLSIEDEVTSKKKFGS